ncbi:MAG: NTP transferase domain-containing protein [Symbiopectobacterium sp.]|uniref:NTP transferase domain-containing protein n=1 Tax=Symbiopectobacterium sp. TaxID=2952789 RepID=UPI0039E798C1
MNEKVCLMLAAGLSSRMGQWKMMLPWGEGTVLDSALAAALSFCDRVVLAADNETSMKTLIACHG